ncbi:HET-domain-containing protein, partial [Acephala macrosclerotiorum]
KTKNDNLENMKRKIPWDEISQTFKDAIHITRQFAFRFLWIDSLCIVQDDAEDWASQAPMMGTIYRQGIFNIAAVESDTPGYRFLPSDVLDIGPIHACPPEDLGAPDRAQAFRGPLDTRAWVLQEYMLSRRTLNYGKNMIFWDCLTKAVSESVPEGADTGDRSISDDYNFIQDFKNGLSGKLTELDNPQTKDGQIFTRAWFLTIEAYTRRNITYETDRLTALAGLATEYQKTTNDLYLAGLWKRNLLDGLLWSVWARGCPTAGNSAAQKGDHGPPGQRYTPSWSWASVSGYTRYF